MSDADRVLFEAAVEDDVFDPVNPAEQPAATAGRGARKLAPTAASAFRQTQGHGEPRVEILESELGFVRVRGEATTDSEHVADGTPGESYSYNVIQDGWYQAEFAEGSWGWVSGTYVSE